MGWFPYGISCPNRIYEKTSRGKQRPTSEKMAKWLLTSELESSRKTASKPQSSSFSCAFSYAALNGYELLKLTPVFYIHNAAPNSVLNVAIASERTRACGERGLTLQRRACIQPGTALPVSLAGLTDCVKSKITTADTSTSSSPNPSHPPSPPRLWMTFRFRDTVWSPWEFLSPVTSLSSTRSPPAGDDVVNRTKYLSLPKIRPPDITLHNFEARSKAARAAKLNEIYRRLKARIGRAKHAVATAAAATSTPSSSASSPAQREQGSVGKSGGIVGRDRSRARAELVAARAAQAELEEAAQALRSFEGLPLWSGEENGGGSDTCDLKIPSPPPSDLLLARMVNTSGHVYIGGSHYIVDETCHNLYFMLTPRQQESVFDDEKDGGDRWSGMWCGGPPTTADSDCEGGHVPQKDSTVDRGGRDVRSKIHRYHNHSRSSSSSSISINPKRSQAYLMSLSKHDNDNSAGSRISHGNSNATRLHVRMGRRYTGSMENPLDSVGIVLVLEISASEAHASRISPPSSFSSSSPSPFALQMVDEGKGEGGGAPVRPTATIASRFLTLRVHARHSVENLLGAALWVSAVTRMEHREIYVAAGEYKKLLLEVTSISSDPPLLLRLYDKNNGSKQHKASPAVAQIPCRISCRYPLMIGPNVLARVRVSLGRGRVHVCVRREEEGDAYPLIKLKNDTNFAVGYRQCMQDLRSFAPLSSTASSSLSSWLIIPPLSSRSFGLTSLRDDDRVMEMRVGGALVHVPIVIGDDYTKEHQASFAHRYPPSAHTFLGSVFTNTEGGSLGGRGGNGSSAGSSGGAGENNMEVLRTVVTLPSSSRREAAEAPRQHQIRENEHKIGVSIRMLGGGRSLVHIYPILSPPPSVRGGHNRKDKSEGQCITEAALNPHATTSRFSAIGTHAESVEPLPLLPLSRGSGMSLQLSCPKIVFRLVSGGEHQNSNYARQPSSSSSSSSALALTLTLSHISMKHSAPSLITRRDDGQQSQLSDRKHAPPAVPIQIQSGSTRSTLRVATIQINDERKQAHFPICFMPIRPTSSVAPFLNISLHSHSKQQQQQQQQQQAQQKTTTTSAPMTPSSAGYGAMADLSNTDRVGRRDTAVPASLKTSNGVNDVHSSSLRIYRGVSVSTRVAAFRLRVDAEVVLALARFGSNVLEIISCSNTASDNDTGCRRNLLRRQGLSGLSSHQKHHHRQYLSPRPVRRSGRSNQMENNKTRLEAVHIADISGSICYFGSPRAATLLNEGSASEGGGGNCPPEWLMSLLTTLTARIKEAPVGLRGVLICSQEQFGASALTQMFGKSASDKDRNANGSSISQMLFEHYVSTMAIIQMLRLVGSAGVLGAPVTLVDSLGNGLHDLIVAPLEDLKRGHIGHFGTGVARGGISLISNSIYGVANTARMLSAAAGGGLARCTLDEKFARQRAMGLENEKPSHALSGISAGVKALGRGVVGGVSGVVVDPVIGARRDGVGGFLGGIGKGMLGLVFKPATGAMDALTQVTEGVRNTTLLLEHKAKPIAISPPSSPPRIAGSDVAADAIFGGIRADDIPESMGERGPREQKGLKEKQQQQQQQQQQRENKGTNGQLLTKGPVLSPEEKRRNLLTPRRIQDAVKKRDAYPLFRIAWAEGEGVWGVSSRKPYVRIVDDVSVDESYGHEGRKDKIAGGDEEAGLSSAPSTPCTEFILEHHGSFVALCLSRDIMGRSGTGREWPQERDLYLSRRRDGKIGIAELRAEEDRDDSTGDGEHNDDDSEDKGSKIDASGNLRAATSSSSSFSSSRSSLSEPSPRLIPIVNKLSMAQLWKVLPVHTGVVGEGCLVRLAPASSGNYHNTAADIDDDDDDDIVVTKAGNVVRKTKSTSVAGWYEYPHHRVSCCHFSPVDEDACVMYTTNTNSTSGTYGNNRDGGRGGGSFSLFRLQLKMGALVSLYNPFLRRTLILDDFSRFKMLQESAGDHASKDKKEKQQDLNAATAVFRAPDYKRSLPSQLLLLQSKRPDDVVSGKESEIARPRSPHHRRRSLPRHSYCEGRCLVLDTTIVDGWFGFRLILDWRLKRLHSRDQDCDDDRGLDEYWHQHVPTTVTVENAADDEVRRMDRKLSELQEDKILLSNRSPSTVAVVAPDTQHKISESVASLFYVKKHFLPKQ
eukprot:jgi/Bigna1/73670/fgenesh1_pg.25_\